MSSYSSPITGLSESTARSTFRVIVADQKVEGNRSMGGIVAQTPRMRAAMLHSL
jgi:hypothetical protein